jgi:G3E family GTPase
MQIEETTVSFEFVLNYLSLVQVKSINPAATILKSQQSRISPEAILNIHAFDTAKNAALFEKSGNEFSTLSSQKGLFHIETNADGKITVPKKKKGFSIGSLGKKQGKDIKNGRSDNTTDSVSDVVDNLLDKSKVSTVSLTSTSPIDLDKFNMWMGQLLQEKGNDLYRFKGILAMENYDEKFVVQGTILFMLLLILSMLC